MSTERSERNHLEPESWEPVPAGMLSTIARRRRASVRWRRASVGGVCVLLVVGAGLLLNGSWRSSQNHTIAGIRCDEVQELLPRLAQNHTIPVEQRTRVEAHLAACPHCCELWEQMQSHSAAARPGSDKRVLVARLTRVEATNW